MPVKNTRIFIVLLAIGMLAVPTFAQDLVRGEDSIEAPAIGLGLCVSNTFQSNMVIQRDKPVAIWGWADPGEKVTVSFAGKAAAAMADKDGSWKIELPAVDANDKPQSITIKGKVETLTLENILVGDVWVLGGQSNMEFPLSKVENGHLEISGANYSGIRILTIPQGASPTDLRRSFPRIFQWSDWSKRHFRKGYWDECTPKIAQELSAIGYIFARRVYKASGVPIGIIDTSRGGTTVETWAPLAALRKMDSAPTKALLNKWDTKIAQWDPKADLEKRIKSNREWVERMTKSGRPVPEERKTDPTGLRPGPIADHNHPGSCYGAMFAPIEGLSVKGVIFHQGYNNAFGGTPGVEMYADVFPIMIRAWREALNDPQLPFGILSLCTDGKPQTLDNYNEMMLNTGIEIRAAQYKAFEDLYKAGDKNIGFASTYDLRRSFFHPWLKLPAGDRIARWALATQYGFNEKLISWKPPMIIDMHAKDDALVLNFDSTMYNPESSEMLGFSIAGNDRRFHPAKAVYVEKGKDNRGRPQYDKTKVVLTSIMVKEPIHFRYAWGRNPLANLQAERNKDLPLATQRSDDWPMHTVPLGVLREGVELPLDRGSKNKLVNALREMDRVRKLTEARKTIEKLKQE